MIPLLLLFALGGLMHAARSYSSSVVSGELAFGFLLLAAYFTAKIVSRIGLPKLTGYIIAGVVSGPYVLGLVTADMTVSLKIVSGTASAIIALEAGSELQLDKIRPVIKTLRALTLFAVIGAMFAIAGTLYWMRDSLPFLAGMDQTQTLAVCMVVAVALSAQSPAVVMALLAETRPEGPLTLTILATVVVADLCVIVCYSIASAITSAVIGGGVDVAATVFDVCWALFGSVAFGIAVGMLIGVFLKLVKSGGAGLFALMICVVVAEVGTRVHLDPLIVMLAAGIYLRNFSGADATQLLDEFVAAQLPVFLVFFALAGVKLHIFELWASIIPVMIIAGVRAGSFFVGARIATAVTGAPDVVKRYAWVGLLPQAGLALALALVLAKSFPFGPSASVILFGVVGFNECIAPPILRFIILRSGEAGKKVRADFAAKGH